MITEPPERTVEIDCEGLLCPLPVLRAARQLRAMRKGEVLCVRATDRMAAIDLPHFCTQSGHQHLGTTEVGPVTLHFIRCGTPGD